MITNYEQFMAEAEKLDPDGFARARAERAEMAALRKDAERYRKLRDGQDWPAAFLRNDAPEPLRGADLDAACDGAA